MGKKKLLGIILCLGILHTCSSYPRDSSSSDEDFSQTQQQQNIDSDSLEEFTQKIQAKGRKPPKLQKAEVPEPHDPCLDPKRLGPCKARVPRYFFNQASGSCESFGWGGCGRNGNNFRELSDCETSCSKHLSKAKLDVQRKQTDQNSVVETCEKPPVNSDVECEAYIPRWKYSPSEQSCVQFVWGGCGKTENNFATKSRCQATCGDYPKVKGLSGTDTTSTVSTTTEVIDLQQNADSVGESGQNLCDLPSDSGICLAAFEKYYFNKLNNRCELFIYGGCGGNKNRFDTAEGCVRACGGDSPTNDLQCSDVECPWALYDHYASLGCSPIYDGEACCPTRYECPDQQQGIQNNTLDSRSLTLEKENTDEGTTVSPDLTTPQKCRYRGKLYSVGEKVNEASDTGSCRAECICADSFDSQHPPRIVCAQIECPEHLGGRPQGKENCVPLYKKGSCCAYDYHCPEGELTVLNPNQQEQVNSKNVLAKCEVDGEGYYEGQRVYPNKSPCSKCLCQRNPNNASSLEGQLYCEKVDCGIEIYYSHYLAQGCAPVYFEKEDGTTTCCPISWECPEEKQQEPESGEVATTPDSSEPEPPKPPSTDDPSLVSPPSPPTPPKPSSPLIRSREACSMEKVEGNCKGHRPRFFFNPDTKMCESFVYTGCKGNLNNFASLEDCRVLCETEAPSPPSPPSKGTKTTGLLGRSRQIETIPNSQPEPKSISLSEVDPCTLPKRVGRCKGYFPRFHYSPEDNECKLFIFGGCRPNANNFYSKDSCEATCLNSIPVENLRTNVPAQHVMPNQRILGNEGGDSSKVNFGDENSVEPRLQPNAPESASTEEQDTICKMPPRTGRCKAFVRRFYYDTDKKFCKSFTYGGCSGNANNFQTLEECDDKCMPKRNIGLHNQPGPRTRLGWRIVSPDGGQGGNRDPSSPVAAGSPPDGARNSLPPAASLTARCKLPKSTGSCHNAIRSYYYDAETQSCKLFFYSGCFGNANRFNSREDCENLCKKPSESEGSSSSNGPVNQPNQPQVHELGESDNDTGSDAEVLEPEHKEFCKLDPAPGDCKANQLRFYYDHSAEQCLPFVYSGCKGNKNNFVTESECMSSCGNKPTLEQLADEMVLSCSFGNQTLPLGSTVGASSDDNNDYTGEEPPCGKPVCQCITPPSVTCVQKMCPEPTTTTTEEPKPCKTPTCLHFCRQTIGLDGCPTCDCDDNDRNEETETVVKKAPVKSVKG